MKEAMRLPREVTSHAHRSYGGRGTINEDSERTAQWRLPDGPASPDRSPSRAGRGALPTHNRDLSNASSFAFVPSGEGSPLAAPVAHTALQDHLVQQQVSILEAELLREAAAGAALDADGIQEHLELFEARLRQAMTEQWPSEGRPRSRPRGPSPSAAEIEAQEQQQWRLQHLQRPVATEEVEEASHFRRHRAVSLSRRQGRHSPASTAADETSAFRHHRASSLGRKGSRSSPRSAAENEAPEAHRQRGDPLLAAHSLAQPPTGGAANAVGEQRSLVALAKGGAPSPPSSTPESTGPVQVATTRGQPGSDAAGDMRPPMLMQEGVAGVEAQPRPVQVATTRGQPGSDAAGDMRPPMLIQEGVAGMEAQPRPVQVATKRGQPGSDAAGDMRPPMLTHEGVAGVEAQPRPVQVATTRGQPGSDAAGDMRPPMLIQEGVAGMEAQPRPVQVATTRGQPGTDAAGDMRPPMLTQEGVAGMEAQPRPVQVATTRGQPGSDAAGEMRQAPVSVAAQFPGASGDRVQSYLPASPSSDMLGEPLLSECETSAADKTGVVQSPSSRKVEAGDDASRIPIPIREEGQGQGLPRPLEPKETRALESLPAICHWAEVEAQPIGTQVVWEFGCDTAGVSHLHIDETPAEEDMLSFLHSPTRSPEESTRQSTARVAHADDEEAPELQSESPAALLSEAEQWMKEEAGRLHRELHRRQSAVAKGAEELSRLKLLVGLGCERRRCHRCDLSICSLRRLLKAIGEVCVATAESTEGSYQPLLEIAEILGSTAHVDARLAELGTWLGAAVEEAAEGPQLVAAAAGQVSEGSSTAASQMGASQLAMQLYTVAEPS
ncbi:PDE9A [Symbiodinium sp. CCMP2592]|nr:PDE9A [Symbiodinium sp. CCMP2592]